MTLSRSQIAPSIAGERFNDAHPESVGSAWGARVYGEAWDAPYVHFGGQATPGTSIYEFFKERQTEGIGMTVDGTRGGEGFHRVTEKFNPHNGCFCLAAFVQDRWPTGADGEPYVPRSPGLTFSDTPSRGSTAIHAVTLRFGDTEYQASFTYDPESKL